ncbi:MAG: SMC-Scp complex subunit ScpB [Caldilineaceae bacterium]
MFNPRPAPAALVFATGTDTGIQPQVSQPQQKNDWQEISQSDNDPDNDYVEKMSEASEDPEPQNPVSPENSEELPETPTAPILAEPAIVQREELELETSPESSGESSETPAVAMFTEQAVIQSAQSDSILSVVNGEDGSITVQVRGEQMSLTAALESLLFVADTSVEIGQFVKLFSLPAEAIERALLQLGDVLKTANRGIRLQMQNGRYRLVSSPAAANLIETFLNLDLSTRLSAPALESLSVIAYRQPVTRAQIEAVRGVDCGHVLRSLLQRGLIEESGRLETAGRPILYSVTEQFMQHFGLTTLNELPPLETTEAARLLEVTEMVEG